MGATLAVLVVEAFVFGFYRLRYETEPKIRFGSANGNRTRITALKGRCANRCTMAPRWERAEI
jgi:hypothetical protein